MFRRDADPKIDRLRAVALFSGASDEALSHLASTVDELLVSEGTALTTEGKRHNEAYVIVSGSVRVEVDGVRVDTATEGRLIGDLRLFGFSPASATCVAEEPTEVISIPAATFGQVLDENPELTKIVATALAGRLHNLGAKVTAG